MKEQILALIQRQNETVSALKNCDYLHLEEKVFTAMTAWHKLACEGSEITHMAREHGIDAKCNMQTGEIYVNNPT